MPSSGGSRFTHGQLKTLIFDQPSNMGKIQSIQLSWKYVYNPLEPSTFCGSRCNSDLYVRIIEITEMNYYAET